jgi:membrane protease YdiL (CAAX protease family)
VPTLDSTRLPSKISSAYSADVIILLTLTALPAVIMWYGLYDLRSAVLTLAIYHGLYLLPLIIWKRRLWLATLKPPKPGPLLVLICTSLLFSGGVFLLYKYLGDYFLNSQRTLELLMRLGYRKGILIPLSIYFVFVNATLEELFWRGVVLNRLNQLNRPFKPIAMIWSSAAYAAFHYPIMRLVLFPGWAEFGTLLLAFYGALLAVIYRRSGSIIFTSLCHAFQTDLAAIVLVVALFNQLHVQGLL